MAGKNKSNRENLLRYLNKEITFEEWEQISGAAVNSENEASDATGAESSLVQEVAAEMSVDTVTMDLSELQHAMPPLITTQVSGGSGEGAEPEDRDAGGPVYIDTEMTVKYLQGEITFEEYSTLLQKQAALDDDEDEEVEDFTAVANVEEVETQSDEAPKEKPVRMKSFRKKKHLNAFQAGLMGEANMQFARGEINEAIRMCFEVVRQVPRAPEPYQTLALIYEEQGDMAKALQFSLIGAHMSPRDVDEWVRVAEMSLDQQQPNQAITCYSYAIKADPKNASLVLARCNLFDRLGETKKALEGYRHVLDILEPGHETQFIRISRDVAGRAHATDDLPMAIDAMYQAFIKCPHHVSAEDINLLLELYFNKEDWLSPVHVLVQHGGVQISYPDGLVLKKCDKLEDLKLPELQPTEIQMPDELPVDLKAKLAVAVIHLQYTACIQGVVDSVLKEVADDVGDLYLDIAEAYMDMGDYRDAKPILAALVASHNYNLAAVWLRYGECLMSLGELISAVSAYERVVALAPSHLAARVSLSALQQQLGRHDEALQALEHEEPDSEDGAKIDLRLVLPRCLLLYSQKKFDDFINTAKQVIFSHFKEIFQPQYMRVIMGSRSLKHRIGAMRHVLGSEFESTIRHASSILEGTNVTVEDFWDLYIKLCEVLVATRRFPELEDITIVALMHPQFMSDPDRVQEADFLCLTACILNSNGHFAYNFIREMCVKDLYNNRAWNLFSQIINMSQEIRHNRFCLRLMVKHPDHYALGLLNGHNAMVAGTYKHALGEYVNTFRQNAQDPINSLCIGLVFVHMASQKFAAKRHALTVQACAFLNQYMELRGECQEAYYNLGRAMHQLGLFHAAVYYYDKALSLPPVITGEEQEIFDLHKETAFNLALLYKNSGSDDLAALVTQQHLVI